MKGSQEVFLFRRDGGGEMCLLLSLVVAVPGGEVWTKGRRRGSGGDKLKKVQEQNGKIVGL